MHRRVEVTEHSTVTDVVTITARDATVWVDGAGRIVKTEYNPAVVEIPSQTTDPAQVAATSAGQNAGSTNNAGNQNFAPIQVSTPAVGNPFGPGQSGSPAASGIFPTPSASGNGSTINGYGICYDMIDSSSQCKTSSTINSEFSFLASQGYGIVRVYDIGCDVGQIATAAAAHNLKVFAGINTITNVASDVAKLISMLTNNFGVVDTINIGNEVVNQGAGAASDVVNALSVARPLLTAAGFKGNIVTVDTFNQHIAHPELCQASDYCAANAHAFFDSTQTGSTAGTWLAGTYGNLMQGAGGKRVVITESGWPYQGQANGNAVPSIANQRAAVQGLKAAMASTPSDLFLFQAYDAGYKPAGAFGIEPYFGIYDTDHWSAF